MDLSGLTSEHIDSLSKLSEEELLREIYFDSDLSGSIKSMSVIEGKAKLTENDKKEATKKGRSIVNGHESKLKEAICIKFGYCSKRSDFMDSLNSLVKAIVPFIVAAVATVSLITAIAIAVLLVFKWGLDKYCGCSEKKAKT